jgi:hypothetical protein
VTLDRSVHESGDVLATQNPDAMLPVATCEPLYWITS